MDCARGSSRRSYRVYAILRTKFQQLQSTFSKFTRKQPEARQAVNALSGADHQSASLGPPRERPEVQGIYDFDDAMPF
jgi:hypothetical protein